ncbi:MAG: 1-acyl-sn-glycerol-3-phosphate acyltransferase [Bacteroidota bacterium]|nr:1-acyl-sn-glycerol-3-phosphate acyltransferase [Bacteroidota bacterium]
MGIKISRTGQVNLNPGSLFISNHRTLIDPAIAFSFVNNGYALSKAEIAHYPIIGKGAEISGVIYVQRDDTHSRKSARATIESFLKKNYSIMLFAEGTTSESRRTLPFKKGAIEAAAAANAPVVYFAMEYMNPKKDFWLHPNLLKQFLITYSKWRTHVHVHFFEPIQSEDPLFLMNKCHDDINAKLVEFQLTWKPKDIPSSLIFQPAETEVTPS